jgi:hypothetical protein
MDRPVKMNPRGKYNLNFIDWDNEWEQVALSGYSPDAPVGESPIYGMSAATFNSLMAQEFRQLQYSEEVVQREVYGLGEHLKDVRQMKVGTSEKECSICIKKFVKDQVIRLLPCKHIFHEECIVPWLEQKSECPNCRFNLKQFF